MISCCLRCRFSATTERAPLGLISFASEVSRSKNSEKRYRRRSESNHPHRRSMIATRTIPITQSRSRTQMSLADPKLPCSNRNESAEPLKTSNKTNRRKWINRMVIKNCFENFSFQVMAKTRLNCALKFKTILKRKEKEFRRTNIVLKMPMFK